MSTHASEILDAAETLLDAHAFTDHCPIGLQVAGRARRVDRIATSVSCTLDVFRRAAEGGAQLLLCHHGLFWKGTSPVIDPVLRERLDALIASGMTLAAYHLPLDAHAGIGNNALLADALGIDRHGRFAEHGGHRIGILGSFPEIERDGQVADGLTIGELATRVRDAVGGREPLILGASSRPIRRIGIVSGAAATDVVEAARLGCDAFLTGEPREDTHALARELDITFVAAGHHATEVLGIRALGELLARRFDLQHDFLDSDNPV